VASRVLSRYAHLLTFELVGGLALLTASAWIFGWLAEELIEGDTHADTRLARWLHERASPGRTEFFEFVTALGNFATLLVAAAVAAVVLARFGTRNELALLLLAFAGSQVLTMGLKLGFQRDRPFFAEPLATESTYSFPSGHASASLAVYGTLGFLLARRLRNRRARVASLAGAAALVLLIGFSRLYLGVHYLTDVLAGFSLGLAWVTLCALALHLRVYLGQTSRYRASTKQ
jgi:membrane-associated phospholipid phosphatase